jgi:uncharacterized cupredoxin-like copper-binding protein
MTRLRIGAPAAVAAALLVWALPAASQATAAKAEVVKVTAAKPSEFRFTLSKASVPAGMVKFVVTNGGTIPHDFKIAGHKTKLLSPGQSQTLTVRLSKPGKYPYLCTVSGHAAAGRRGVLTVGSAVPKSPVKLTVTAATHAPRVKTRWHYAVHVTRAGRAVAGKISVRVVDPTGKTHPVTLGTSTKKLVNHPIKGVFRDFIVWPASSRGVPLKLRITAVAGTAQKSAVYAVKPKA